MDNILLVECLPLFILFMENPTAKGKGIYNILLCGGVGREAGKISRSVISPGTFSFYIILLSHRRMSNPLCTTFKILKHTMTLIQILYIYI